MQPRRCVQQKPARVLADFCELAVYAAENKVFAAAFKMILAANLDVLRQQSALKHLQDVAIDIAVACEMARDAEDHANG